MTTRIGKAALVAASAALLIGAAGWHGGAGTRAGERWFASAMDWLNRPLVG